MKRTKTLTAAALIGLALIAGAKADDTDTTNVNGLRDGSWSLQFQIGEDFNLQSFEGSTISAKYHLTENSALRFGLSISGRGDRSEPRAETIHTKTSHNDTGRSDTTKSFSQGPSSSLDQSSFRVVLNSKYVWYPGSSSSLRPFVGIGPSFSYDTRANASSQSGADTSTYSTLRSREWSEFQKEERRTWTVGAALAIGAEWFMTDKISLTGQYSLSASYRNSRTVRRSEAVRTIRDETGGQLQVFTDDFVSERAYPSTGFSVSSQGVKFGLSVYF